jgi:hypothetical protein
MTWRALFISLYTAAFSVLIFRNQVTAQGVFGYSITMVGCAVYHREKQRQGGAG